MKKILSLLVVITGLFAVSLNAQELQTVPHVDLQRYLGKWYEIARFDVWFEKNCTNVTAEYSPGENNTINVLNSCKLYSVDGKKKQAYGRAVVVDKNTNAKLKVSFLPKILSWFDRLFSGNYWIIKLEDDYSVALIGEPSREYLWILSRKSTLSDKKYAEYVKAAQDMGFDVTKIHKTIQN